VRWRRVLAFACVIAPGYGCASVVGADFDGLHPAEPRDATAGDRGPGPDGDLVGPDGEILETSLPPEAGTDGRIFGDSASDAISGCTGTPQFTTCRTGGLSYDPTCEEWCRGLGKCCSSECIYDLPDASLKVSGLVYPFFICGPVGLPTLFCGMELNAVDAGAAFQCCCR
jgi:hypothetical protein